MDEIYASIHKRRQIADLENGYRSAVEPYLRAASSIHSTSLAYLFLVDNKVVRFYAPNVECNLRKIDRIIESIRADFERKGQKLAYLAA